MVARLHDRHPSWVRTCLPVVARSPWCGSSGVWRCAEPACPRHTWIETSAAIRPRASLTERARREDCWRVGEDGHSLAQVAAACGVDWVTLMRAVRDVGAPLVDDPARLADVAALGVDETASLAATAHQSTTLVTGVVDLTGPQLIGAGNSQ